MKSHKKYQAIAAIIIAGAFAIFNPGTAGSQLDTNVPSDLSAKQLLAVVVEDFENAKTAGGLNDDGWFVQTTPRQFDQAKREDQEKRLKMKNPVPVLDLRIVEGSPGDLAPEKWSLTEKGTNPQKCLGVRFRFRYPGTNTVHILPPKEVDWKSGEPVMTYNPRTGNDEPERGLQLPGRAQAVSMWVHARGKPYNLEVWVKDYRGNTHVLPMGSLNFVGWRPMRANIPSYIPQATPTYPQTRITKITSFVLRANTMARHETLTEDTFVFFDQIKVLTDTYEVNFDGSELHEQFK